MEFWHSEAKSLCYYVSFALMSWLQVNPWYPILPPTSSQNTCTDSSSYQSLVILDTLFQTRAQLSERCLKLNCSQ